MLFSKISAVLSALAFSSLTSAQTACNNSPALCNRAYTNITHLGAHDAAFVANSTNKYTIAGNQFFDSVTQLSAGVRMLTAQIHRVNDSSLDDPTLRLCHTNCMLYDAGTLLNWLTGIKNWLDANKNEVVTLLLVNSVGVDTETLGGVFSASGISDYGYVPTAQTTPISNWPTLQSMITSNKRLVTWIASLNGTNTAAPYLLDEFPSVFENQYAVYSASNFSCQPNRPTSLANQPTTALNSGRLFLMNHFLDIDSGIVQVPDVDAANTTNSADPSIVGSLAYSANQCSALYGKAPNYVLVDWASVGPAITSIDTLNGVTGNTTGRTAVSSAICSQSGASCYTTSSTSTASTTKTGGANGRLTREASTGFAALAAVFFAALLL